MEHPKYSNDHACFQSTMHISVGRCPSLTYPTPPGLCTYYRTLPITSTHPPTPSPHRLKLINAHNLVITYFYRFNFLLLRHRNPIHQLFAVKILYHSHNFIFREHRNQVNFYLRHRASFGIYFVRQNKSSFCIKKQSCRPDHTGSMFLLMPRFPVFTNRNVY